MAGQTPSERIKAAREAQQKAKDYRDVDVVLDQDTAEQVQALEEQIAAKEAEISAIENEKARIAPEMRFSDPRGRAIDEQIAPLNDEISDLEEQRDAIRASTLMTLRFDKMPGEQWATIASHHPGRIDSAIDQLSGYNYHAAAREAAPICGYALGEDETREDLTREDWQGIFEVISGRETEAIATSLWEMNDFGPRRRIDAARKASAAATASKSS